MSMTFGRIVKAKDNKGNIYQLSGEKGMPEVDGILLYGWENYIVENFKKPYSVSLLSLSTEDPIDDYRFLGASMFPTIAEGTVEEKHFFGSVKYNDEILYILLAKPDITKVYFLSKGDVQVGKVEDMREGYYKLVWFVEGSKELPDSINVMYIGLNDIEMPYRNMTSYLEPINHSPISISDQEKYNVVYDNLTGTILGNEKVESTPLLNFIKSVNTNKNWNPRNTYRLGEEVKWGESTYISLKDWNLGEQPGLSMYWQDKNDFDFLRDKHKFKIEVLNDKGKTINEYPGHLSFRTYVNTSKLYPTITFEDGYFLAAVEGDNIKPVNGILEKSVESYINGTREISLIIERDDEAEDIGEITLVFLKKAGMSGSAYYTPEAIIKEKGESSLIKQQNLTDYKQPFSIKADILKTVTSIEKAVYVLYGQGNTYYHKYSFNYTDWEIGEGNKLIIHDTYDIPFSYEYAVTFGSNLTASFTGYKGYFVDHIVKEIESGKNTEFKLMPIDDSTTTTLKIKIDGSVDIIPGESKTSQGDTIRLSNIDSNGIYTLTIDSGATHNHTFEVI